LKKCAELENVINYFNERLNCFFCNATNQKMKMRIYLATTALSFLLAGCVMEGPTNRSGSIASEAHAAQLRGDWARAAQLWEQAIRIEQGIWEDPELANSPKLMAIYYYELGRSLGVLGLYDEGEKDLLQALRLDKKFNVPIGMDLTELARLNYARGNNTQAAFYFKQIMPHLDEAISKNPAESIAIMNEAAFVAKALGDNEWATQLKEKSEIVSNSHGNLKLPEDWTPYKMSETPSN
jgi:tetratricopeptide (TPR) repeat protein